MSWIFIIANHIFDADLSSHCPESRLSILGRPMNQRRGLDLQHLVSQSCAISKDWHTVIQHHCLEVSIHANSLIDGVDVQRTPFASGAPAVNVL